MNNILLTGGAGYIGSQVANLLLDRGHKVTIIDSLITGSKKLVPKKANFIKPISYSVVKHGIIGLTKYTASYWSKKNIRCNAIAPGGIFNNQDSSFIKKIDQLIPLGRMAKKNEYNGLILFLCSDLSSYITGSVIVADGGRSII